MRALADKDRIARFVRALSSAAHAPTRLYLVGGATAVWLGWRPSTVDLDIKLVPESDSLLRAISRLKDELQTNVELAAPSDFIPELPGWDERSPFVMQEGKLSVYHYDLYAQALAKIERGHRQDVEDVRAMLKDGLVDRVRLHALFAAIEPQLYRYPALNAAAFRHAVEAAISG